jgi:hypothetical protein
MAKRNKNDFLFVNFIIDLYTVLKRRACQRKPAGKSKENVRNHRHDRISSQPIRRKILVENQSKPGYASVNDV